MTEAEQPGALLQTIVMALDAFGIAHMVVGSFASTFHGVPRTTQDLDLVIDPTEQQLELLLAALPPDRFYVDPDVAREALRRRTMFNVIEMLTAWKLDLVICKARPFSLEEMRRREVVSIMAIAVNIATAEDTIIAKLEWSKASGSERQLEDVAGILRVRGENLDRAYIQRWVDELGLAAQWQLAQRRSAGT
ncbi:MAG: hypothetical protein H0T89_21505 [Deltaproteobacteria bacterium]|nr:hypothetical protein [Deltaproteobacteria bacterium]MDQ3297406.1 hypothetical protein [Myxococcota bacterium]